MRKNKESEKLPGYTMHRIYEKREQVKTILDEYLGYPLSGTILWELADKLSDAFKVEIGCMQDLLIPFTGNELGARQYDKIVKYLPANYYRIDSNELINIFDGIQVVEEWALATIGFVGEESSEVPVGVLLHSGLSVGSRLLREISIRFVDFITRELGLFRLMRKENLVSYGYLVGSECFVKISAANEFSSKSRFTAFRTKAAQQQQNRELLKARLRTDTCKFGYKPDRFRECTECFVGYAPHDETHEYCGLSIHERWHNDAG